MDLREWMTLHVRHKDAYAKALKSVAQEGERTVFTFKDHVLTGYALDELRIPAGIGGKTLIVTLHNEANVKRLLSDWGAFCAHKDLTVIFANPARNEKWVVKPRLHEDISEGNIEPGIRAMAEGVTRV